MKKRIRICLKKILKYYETFGKVSNSFNPDEEIAARNKISKNLGTEEQKRTLTETWMLFK
jgi:hypothetical protein